MKCLTKSQIVFGRVNSSYICIFTFHKNRTSFVFCSNDHCYCCSLNTFTVYIIIIIDDDNIVLLKIKFPMLYHFGVNP